VGGEPRKRTVCKFWMIGRCVKGALCEYLHQVAGTPAEVPLCDFFQEGTCDKEGRCLFRHAFPERVRRQNGLCPAVRAGGACPEGDACRFEHRALKRKRLASVIVVPLYSRLSRK
jgi:cleavage and polyadenylation specificity factor subunit 4